MYHFLEAEHISDTTKISRAKSLCSTQNHSKLIEETFPGVDIRARRYGGIRYPSFFSINEVS